MTLDRERRQIVRGVVDEDILSDAVIRAVEGDEMLDHLAESHKHLRHAEASVGVDGDVGALARQVRERAERRAKELLSETEGVEV